ncbi:MAG: hypothetical protein ACR2KB_07140, partial [Chitinophagaceae bacterium]
MLNYLYSKKINWIIIFSLILAIISRSFLEYLLFDFVNDKQVQIATALNFLDGKGISLAYVEANNLSRIIYEKVGLWPPGFVLGIVPFIKMGFSPIRASIIIEIFSIIILFSSFYLIFKLLKKRIHYIIPILFFIFYGFSLHPFNFLFTTGLTALSFCLLAIYFLLRNLSRNDLLTCFGLGVASFLPSFFHFSYYPISFLLPILFLLYSLFIDVSKRAPAISNVFICILLLAGQFYYQASLPSGINYLSGYYPVTTGFPYWENLKMFLNLPIYLLTDGFILKRTISRISNDIFF